MIEMHRLEDDIKIRPPTVVEEVSKATTRKTPGEVSRTVRKAQHALRDENDIYDTDTSMSALSDDDFEVVRGMKRESERPVIQSSLQP